MPSLRALSNPIRYAFALSGSVAAAAAQFILSLLLLRLFSPGEFGTFSFLLVTSQLSWGIWSALFCAPLPTLIATAGDRSPPVRAVMAANLVAVVAAAAVFFAAGIALGQPVAGAAIFAGYAAVSLFRWFGRAHGYATGAVTRTILSDLTYGGTLLAATAALWWRGGAAPALAYAALLASATVGLLPLGRAFLWSQLSVGLRAARDYRGVWTDHARWSLLGVLTTEATANAHVYLVTLLQGAAAFAPIAASTLVIRPMNVAINALGDYERARMARHLGERRTDRVWEAMRFFRIALGSGWIATVAGVALVFEFAPHLLFPARYPLDFLVATTAMWLAITAVRLARTPDSILLQAAGAFRPLALASIGSAAVSIAAVAAFLLAAGPLWSILGILAGEVMFAVAIWRRVALRFPSRGG